MLYNAKRVLVIKPEWSVENLFDIVKNMMDFNIGNYEEDKYIIFQIYVNYRLFWDKITKDRYNEKLSNVSILCMNYFEEVVRESLEHYFDDEDTLKTLIDKFLKLVNGRILNSSNHEFIISENNIFNGDDNEGYWT